MTDADPGGGAVMSDAERDREAVFAAFHRQRIVEALGRLSLPGLMDLLDEVLRARTVTDSAGDEHRLVLAVASWYPGSPTHPGTEVSLSALGLPDPARNDKYHPGAYCQTGTCRTCRAEIVSDIKRALCPVCHTPVSLT